MPSNRSRVTALLVVFFLVGSLVGVQTSAGAAQRKPTPTTAKPKPKPAPKCVPGRCEPSRSLVAAAKRDGRLTTYMVVDAAVQQKLYRAFQKRYNIDVNFAQVTVADAIARAEAEHQSGRVTVDIVSHSNDLAHRAFSKDRGYAPLRESEIPNLAAVVKDKAMYQGTWAYLGGPAWGLGWNTKQVAPADVPKDWCGMAAPKWKGKIGLIDQPGGASIYLTYKLMEKVCGRGFLQKLAANNPKWFVSVAPATSALVAGELSLLMVTISSVEVQAARGAPVDAKPVNGLSVGARFYGIMAKAPNPNAAKLFVNWLYSVEAQKLMFGGRQGVSVLSDAVLPDAVKAQPLTELASSETMPPAEIDAIRQRLGRR